MPVNSNRNPRFSVNGSGGNAFGLANTTSFLFDEEDDKLNAIDLTSPIAKAFAQLEGDDTFPTLTSDGLKVLRSLSVLSTRAYFSLALCQLCSFGSCKLQDSGSGLDTWLSIQTSSPEHATYRFFYVQTHSQQS